MNAQDIRLSVGFPNHPKTIKPDNVVTRLKNMRESWGQRKGGSMKETVSAYRRHDISDETWALLEPHLPGRRGVWGGIAEDNRLFINAVFWILRTGAPWRDLPPDHGGWRNTHRRFIRWRNTGIWEK